MFLEIDRVSASYGANKVLDDISLSVGKGELVALLGSSGCGKTTLLRVLSGFHAAGEGSVRINGADMTALPPEKRDTAMVFQSYALWPHMTVAQNIGYGLRLRKTPKAEIDDKVTAALDMVGLTGFADRMVTQLSGGQRQRVALARAIVVNPAVLLMDEPLSNLDARIRHQVRHEIKAIQARLGLTAVLVTHDQEEAMIMADRIVVMKGGKIEQLGTPEEIYSKPATPFVAEFMGADNRIDADYEIDGERITIRMSETREAQSLPRSLIAHLADLPPKGRLRLHFRASSVSLAGADEAASQDCLSLGGKIRQRSYPGGTYRYAVALGDRQLLVDYDQQLAEGESVRVVLPVSALMAFPAL
ncbi:ABC transporter ATP-binding protein [Lacibacterium aquatile]|uniref:ABC transporter ATP-binding protein n=1 Tax=Lacibacterium aquatile TaxID=1168082 RepID=A0ABW5DT38_9PROT